MSKPSPRNLEKRLEQIADPGNAWIPPWLRAVGSREEVAEWSAIRQARRGRDYHERVLEFIRGMRKKYPDMPLSFEEELEARREQLKRDPALRRAEGLDLIESPAEEGLIP
jgi:hypothetical protein